MSDLLNSASLVLIPSGYKEDTVYSVVPSDGSGDLSFTRASNGTRVNSAGLVEVCPWNLCINSEQFDTGAWLKSNTTVTANSGVAPNGTTTADKIVPTTTGTSRWAEQSRAITIGNFYTNSAYIKADGFSWVALHHIDGNIGAWFNVSNGTVGTVNSGCTALIESVGNGWYRCSVAKNSGGTIGYTVVQLADADNSATATASGTNGLLIWGAQANIGSTAKPYFPTTDRLNVPRLTYQNGGGGCPSLLLEKQSTNLIEYSEDFSGATWTNEDIIVSTNQTISPDGTQNADKLIANTTTLDHSIYQTSSGSTRTFSVYAKAGEYNYIFLGSNNNIASDGAFFNLSNGTISQNTSGLTASIESVGNGWYRCIVSSTSWPTIYTIICLSTNGTSLQFTGNNTSGIYVWGVQVEQSSYPTSYIPTTSSSATRVADVCSKTGISSLIGASAGVVYFEGTIEAVGSLSRRIISLSDGTNANTLVVYNPANTNSLEFVMASSGVTEVIINATSAVTFGQKFKFAFAYANNDFVFYVNGTQIGVDTSGTVPASLSKLVFGRGDENPSVFFEGTISQTLLFKTRLSNTELAQITTL